MPDLVKKEHVYYEASRADMLRFVDGAPKCILEVGCGAGNFSRNFTDVEYWGVEPNEQMATNARKIAHTVLTGTYDDVTTQIPDAHFDLIVCNDVIEHMTDPAGFLKSVKAKLKTGGKMIVSLPNLRNIYLLYDLIFHGDFTYTQSGLLDYTHFHMFTQKSFSIMATECGWHVDIIEPLEKPDDFKPLKKLVLRFLEHGNYGEMRTMHFAARLSPAHA